MHLITKFTTLTSVIILASCIQKGPNPEDPYESINRKTYQFNTIIDAIFIKPPARLYKAIVPTPIRTGVNNFYNNITLIPTIANDLLQAEWHHAENDMGRLLVNSSIGIGGLIDVASQVNIPLHNNDLGLTFARWGDKKSPYIVIPLLGPSTIRDGMGVLFEYPLMTPYPLIHNDTLLYSLLGLHYIDLRAQFLNTEQLIDDAFDKYSFVRDAYLQHRRAQITGDNATNTETASGYIEDDNNKTSDLNYVDEKATSARNESSPLLNSSDYVDEISNKN
jgi:phospholipid-binding lipoprotein MlaA